MKKDIEMIFEPLKQTLLRHPLTDADLFEVIGGFAGSPNPEIAQAMCFHARDITQEDGDQELAYNAILAEVYRRTFFDEQAADKYGTGSFARSGLDTLRGLSEHLCNNIAAEEHEIDPAQLMGTPDTPQ